MLSAFRRVSLRHLASHKLRTFLTASGIALGVAAMIGIRLVNDSATRSFGRTIDRMAGKAVFQIANGSAGVPEELLAEVKAVGGVKVAAPSVQGFLPVSSLRGERLFVFGIDLLADPEIHEYASGSSETEVEDPLVFLAQPDSVAVTTELLKRHGLAEGDKIEVTAAGASTALTIRATLDIHTGPATIGTLFPNVFGIQALYRYPLTAALFAFAAAIALAAAAGYFAGRSASRLRITEALQYE
jgi:putative ABC transport system permease protein